MEYGGILPPCSPRAGDYVGQNSIKKTIMAFVLLGLILAFALMLRYHSWTRDFWIHGHAIFQTFPWYTALSSRRQNCVIFDLVANIGVGYHSETQNGHVVKAVDMTNKGNIIISRHEI